MEEKKEARQKRNREKLATADWVMAEFYATWCPHCKRMQPVVEEFKKLMEGTLEVVQIDIDQEDALANFYTIESVPTFILMREGEQLWRQSGELDLERLLSVCDNPCNPCCKDCCKIPVLVIIRQQISDSIRFYRHLPDRELVLFPAFEPLDGRVLSLFVGLFLTDHFFRKDLLRG